MTDFAFSPFDDFVLATASQDCTVCIMLQTCKVFSCMVAHIFCFPLMFLVAFTLCKQMKGVRKEAKGIYVYFSHVSVLCNL